MQKEWLPKGTMIRRVVEQAIQDAQAGFTDLNGDAVEDYAKGLRVSLNELPLRELIETYDAMIGFQPR